MWWWSLWACAIPTPPSTGGADDARVYAAALATVRRTPAATATACAAVRPPALHADCVVAGVERLSRSDPAAARALCAALPAAGLAECSFRLAEGSGDPADCAAAGPFQTDCRMHLWSRRVDAGLPAAGGPAAWAAALGPELSAFGLDTATDAPWIALFRAGFGRAPTLDPAGCPAVAAVAGAAAAAACPRAAEGLLHDRWNHTRDTAGAPCAGPLPPHLDPGADPSLQAVIAQRRAEPPCATP
jgi:hypothetical protein